MGGEENLRVQMDMYIKKTDYKIVAGRWGHGGTLAFKAHVSCI